MPFSVGRCTAGVMSLAILYSASEHTRVGVEDARDKVDGFVGNGHRVGERVGVGLDFPVHRLISEEIEV